MVFNTKERGIMYTGAKLSVCFCRACSFFLNVGDGNTFKVLWEGYEKA